MSYNGWTNRETWLINLYFEELLTEIVDEILDDESNHSADEPMSAYELGELLEQYIDDMIYPYIEELPIYLQDFVTYNQVDWRDLALTYMADWEEEKES